jgi:hypothetical protein
MPVLIGDVTEVYCWTDRPVWPQGSYGANTPNGLKWPTESAHSAQAPLTGIYGKVQLPSKTIPYRYRPTGRRIAVLPFNWSGWWDYGTGVLGDMGAHILHGPMKVLGLQLMYHRYKQALAAVAR